MAITLSEHDRETTRMKIESLRDLAVAFEERSGYSVAKELVKGLNELLEDHDARA
jgi:hypothetical protein